MTAAGKEAETSTSSARRLWLFNEIFSFILLANLQFWGVHFYFSLENVIPLLTKQLFLVVFHVLCAMSWTFMSLPVSRGVCSQFVSYLVQLVSLLYTVYTAFFSSLWVVECNGSLFARYSVLCSLWFLAYCFSMKYLHIDQPRRRDAWLGGDFIFLGVAESRG